MKKITLTTIFALFLVLSVSAQNKVGFGLKAGLNTAMEWADEGTTDARIGFHGGIFLEIPVANRLDIQPELMYSMQGAADDSGTDKIDYINLPIIFKIYVNRSRSFSIDVGPQAGYAIYAKRANKNGSSVNMYDHKDFNKFDAAICLGISYKITKNFHAGLRFNISVTSFGKANKIEYRHGVGQLGVSFRF